MKKHFSEFWYRYVLGVVVVLIIFAYCRVYDLVEQTTDEIVSTYYLTDVASEDIVAVSYRGNSGQELSFEKKEDGVWVYAPDESLAIEQAGPQYLAELLKKVAGEYQIDEVEDISPYGLSENSPYVEIVTKEKTSRIYIGNYNEIVKRYYAYEDGRNTTIYGIQQEIAEILDYTLEHYLLDEPAKADGATIWKIGVIGSATGGANVDGNSVQQGAQVAIDEINMFGGINGYMVDYKFLDDENNPEKKLSAYEEFMEWGAHVVLVTSDEMLEDKDKVVTILIRGDGKAEINLIEKPSFADMYQAMYGKGPDLYAVDAYNQVYQLKATLEEAKVTPASSENELSEVISLN